MRRFFSSLLRTVVTNNIGALAAIIAYFAFSSMIPALLLLIYFTSRLIPGRDVERSVIDLLHAYVPALPQEMSLVTTMVQRLESVGPDIGVLGLLGGVWNTVGGFMSLQWILDKIWGIQHRRAFLRQYLVGFVMFIGLLALTLLSALATEIVRVTSTAAHSAVNIAGLVPLVQDVTYVAFPLLLFGTCFAIYSLLPSHVAPLFARLVGAATATGGIFLSRSLFLIYTHHLQHYQAMYGALSFIMLLTFWIYIVSVLLLFGGAVTVSLERAHDDGESSPHRPD